MSTFLTVSTLKLDPSGAEQPHLLALPIFSSQWLFIE